MNKTNYAFPMPYAFMPHTNIQIGGDPGLTKREWFAGMAMCGMLSRDSFITRTGTQFDIDNIKDVAYRIADVMMNEE